ncbi:uncharacterized protein CANTADRAFT_49337 [Suhomyces tanzawaensis NRRL Y-17324]|uniref:Conserved oligomeric Golgi complex subunit 3 n=1 Tax=Suhomyces tanzawaensis NRRL Y-17324 TaxID=984487 RepID=A0A1E4SLP5_9ASCO|nr:uncharacterized protein CANTADRAFT_49337 [Suhomyces tanzawaensis NRRL Y-17324]ODV80415.1 hypothetical protein CANTADRAFT_49337 [Suhomyces tanzawaensis NRRL Y-17324]
MTRTRSKSIIQKISKDTPHYAENLDFGEKKSVGNRPRSSSLDIQRPPVKISSITPTYPFSDKEKASLWSNYINSFNYDCLLDPEHILAVNELETDEFYNFQDICKYNQLQVMEYITETDEVMDLVESLTLKYDQIASETIDFDTESSKLLNSQMTYTTKFRQIEEYLKHFENLDAITRHLSKPGYNLVNQRREFFRTEILSQLDQSLLFFKEHPDFKEVELYNSRFRQCMTRALTLVKNFVVSEIKKLSEAVNKSLSSENGSSISIDLLVYNEFNSYLKENGTQFSELINEITSRIAGHQEYQGLINDVLNEYFQVRLHLLQIYFSKNTYLQNLLKTNISSKDLVQSCQDQISFFKKVSEKEYILFKNFFGVEGPIDSEFYHFSRNLLDPLYDSLRHITLRETNISNLCQLTTLLQKYYEFEEQEETLIDVDNPLGQRQDVSINFGELFEPILHDVQSRLIFRIQNYVDEKLMKYIPKPEDLQLGRRRRSTPATEDNSVPINPLDVDYPENLFPEVYLPLGKALTLLSNIYELINSVVFDDLAHYIVHACIILLKGEFYKLSLTHLGLVDTKLHYLKNLIILKGQINNFDIQYIRTDYTIDFTSGISEVWTILRNGEFNLNDNGLIDLVKKSAPKIISDMIDANYEIESELNNAVNDFIKECTNSISEPITLNDKDTLTESVDRSIKFKDNLIIKIPNIYKQIKIFINDDNIIKFLMGTLSELVVSTYENFYKYVLDNADKIDQDTREHLDEIQEVETVFGFINDLISQLYEQDQEVVFNEDILLDGGELPLKSSLQE